MHPEKSSAGLECSSSKRFSTILSTGAAPSSSFPAVSPEPMSSDVADDEDTPAVAIDFSVFQDEAVSASSNASDRRRCRQRAYEQRVGVRRDERRARGEQQPVHHVDEDLDKLADKLLYVGPASVSSVLMLSNSLSSWRVTSRAVGSAVDLRKPGCRAKLAIVAEDSRHGGLVESPGNGTGLGHASLTAAATTTVVVVGKRLVLVGGREVLRMCFYLAEASE
ncbi:hypothetical protein C8J57DRAFT_1243260 [Mycena rebaudengoi]|nr:hypothetical protein C8J57DRAFT_1243260 [Mycena rebaudengoi]